MSADPLDLDLDINIDLITMSMLRDFRKHTGRSLLDFTDGAGDLTIDLDDLSTLEDVDNDVTAEDVLTGFIWLAMRCNNPAVTWEDALNTPLSSLGAAEAPPEPATAGTTTS